MQISKQSTHKLRPKAHIQRIFDLRDHRKVIYFKSKFRIFYRSMKRDSRGGDAVEGVVPVGDVGVEIGPELDEEEGLRGALQNKMILYSTLYFLNFILAILYNLYSTLYFILYQFYHTFSNSSFSPPFFSGNLSWIWRTSIGCRGKENLFSTNLFQTK